MSWLSQTPKSGTGPEEQLHAILRELELKFDLNVPEDAWTEYAESFSIYPREADVIVEGVLVIEVQGSGPRLHDKPIRRRKDKVKALSVAARGLGYLELWDDELRKASQVEAGKTWRPAVKEWILTSLTDARLRNKLYHDYRGKLPEPPMVTHPDYGVARIDRRRE